MAPSNDLAIDGVRLETIPTRAPDGRYLVDAEGLRPGVYVDVLAGETQVKKGLLAIRGYFADTLSTAYPGDAWHVSVGDREFGIQLRHVRFPLPFTLSLSSFNMKEHPGTRMPADYSSDIVVLQGEIEQPVRIWMNNPLRRDDYVVYQASYGPDKAVSGPYYTSLAVSRNPSDQWPLWACILAGFGMVLHFCMRLLRYITSEQKNTARTRAESQRAAVSATEMTS